MNTRIRTLSLLATALSLTTLALAHRVEASSVVPRTVEETARDAGAILVGRVVKRASRWSDRAPRRILTDVTVQVEEALLPHGSVRTGHPVTLTFWGGAIGEVVHGVAGVPVPEEGERLVFMLRPGYEKPGFSPAVGLHLGLFRVQPAPGTPADAAPGTHRVSEYEGPALVVTPEGTIERNSLAAPEGEGERPATLAEFLQWLRTNLPRWKATGSGPSAPEAPERTLEMSSRSAKRARTHGVRRGARVMDPRLLDLPRSVEDLGENMRLPLIPTEPRWSPAFDLLPVVPTAKPYKIMGHCEIPIVMNQLLEEDEASPEDQRAMAMWNFYADVFRISREPTGSYGWDNDSFDIAGFVSSEDLEEGYGSGWDEGTLAVTVSARMRSTQQIVEADVLFNPEWDWTLDDEAIYAGETDAQGYRATMLHELGHVLGLDHEFSELSIMNYSPAAHRGIPLLYAQDAEGARTIYPRQSKRRTDLGIFLYSHHRSRQMVYVDGQVTGSVRAGSKMTVRGYHLENAGTESVQTPTVEWYLTEERNYDGSYHYLGSTTHESLNRAEWLIAEAQLSVPASVPSGEYYLAAFIRGDESPKTRGFPFHNSTSWTRGTIQVRGR